MLYIYSQSGVRMKQCKICYSTILPEDYVEWVITQENHKYILGKYKWVACDYCFACINIAKSSLWSLYLNTLLNVDCNNALTQILENPLPVYITEHLCLFDKPIKALYYHKQMYSAKLLFADQSGLWLAGPELFSTLQYFTEEQVILVDQYSNPVKVDRLRLLTRANQVYSETMSEWFTEYESLKNNR